MMLHQRCFRGSLRSRAPTVPVSPCTQSVRGRQCVRTRRRAVGMSDLGHHRAAERADPVDARLRAFAATTPSRLDVPLSEAYSRSGGGGELLAAVRALLALGGVSIGPPGPRDYVVLLRGMPVAPWMRLRPAADVWGTWVHQPGEIWPGLRGIPASTPAAPAPAA